MSKRTIWQAPGGLITEPSDKEWNEDELVAAEHLNWFFEQVEADLDDLNDLAHIGSSAPTKNLKQLIVGSSGLYRGGTDEGGVALYTAFNAEWTGSDWEEIDDTKGDPALIAHNVTDASQLDGISASDLHGDEWVFLRALTVDASNVITWEIAPINISSIFNLTIREVLEFGDRDSDDFHWKLTEDPSTGHLHISHPEIPTGSGDVGDVKVRQDGTFISESSWTMLDGANTIASALSDGATATGTFDVVNDGNIPDHATGLLLRAVANTSGSLSNDSIVKVKPQGFNNFHEVARDQETGNSSPQLGTNIFRYGLNGESAIEYDLQAGGQAFLEYIGWRA